MGEKKVQTGCGVILFNDKGEFLLLKRKSKHAYGKYCVPGGWIEFGEELLEAGAREVMEEVGVEVKDIKIIGVTNNLFPEEDKHTVSVMMAAKIKSGEPKNMEPEKCESLNWFKDWDNLPEPIMTKYNQYVSADMLQDYLKKS